MVHFNRKSFILYYTMFIFEKNYFDRKNKKILVDALQRANHAVLIVTLNITWLSPSS